MVNIRYLYDKFNKKKSAYRIRRDMKNKLNKCGATIPELTEKEKCEIIERWGHYDIKPDLNAFRWLYHVSGVHDWRFITEDVYAEYMFPSSFNVHKAQYMDDKNYYDLYFPDVKKAKTLIRNINGKFLDKNYKLITKEAAIYLVKMWPNDKVVIKPSINSCKGQGVMLINKMDIEYVLEEYKYKENFIVQECIKQHKLFSSLCSTSSNIIRVTTVLLNQVYLFLPTVRVGDEGKFTDQGGKREFCIGIDESGRLADNGITSKYEIWHENTLPNGYHFGGNVVPGFHEIRNICKLLHPRMASFPIIGWDFIVDEIGDPVLVECNLYWTGIFKYQECGGPLFGDMTESVLTELLKKDE